ncbi:MAG: hypothetical protein QMD32_06695, partial [Smithellaceae bacterium]|nr:hypothetical protein [Smithellaceae bacterium]
MIKEGGVRTKSLKVIAIPIFISLFIQGIAQAGGPFGPPQPISKKGGGLYTGIGYWSQEDKYHGSREHLVKQNQVYSELGYGPDDNWGIYARVGVTDLKIIDAFGATAASTTVSKRDFENSWKYFGTLGAKIFYPFNRVFGMGALVQGTYYFNDFTDSASGTQSGAPFFLELAVKKLWDVRFGVGLQATLLSGLKMYAGPYFYYSEAKVNPSARIPGIALAAGETT